MAQKDSKGKGIRAPSAPSDRTHFPSDRYFDEHYSESTYKLAMLVAQIAQGKSINEHHWREAELLLLEADNVLSDKWGAEIEFSLRLHKDLAGVKIALGSPDKPIKQDETIKGYLDAAYPAGPEYVETIWAQALDGERIFTPESIELFKKVRKSKYSERSKKGAETRRDKSQKAVR